MTEAAAASPYDTGAVHAQAIRLRARKLRTGGGTADDWRKRHPDFREPQLSRNLRVVRLLRAIGCLHGRTPAEVAVAWVLHNPAVTGAIVGARRPGQISGVVGAAELHLREFARIGAFFTPVTA